MSARMLKLVGPVHVVGRLPVFATGFVPAAQGTLKPLIATSDNLAWSPLFLAVLRPIIAGWGVLFTVIVCQFLSAPSPGLWKAMDWSVAIWVLLDTALCLRFGVYGGAILNAAVVAALIILLLHVRKMAYG